MSLVVTSVKEKDRCPVCLENFKNGATGMLGHVKDLQAPQKELVHLMHGICVKNLLESAKANSISLLCPLCRLQITHVNGVRVSSFDLCLAASMGQLEEIRRETLGDPSSISEKDRGDAVKAAAVAGRLKVVKYLLSGSATISEGLRGRAILAAAGAGRLKVVKYLLSGGATISTGLRGRAILAAARAGRLKVVKYLLSDGSLITESERGRAVLAAAENGYLEVVKWFLLNGATIPEYHRGEAVKAAEAGGHLEVMRYLRQEDDSDFFRPVMTPLILAVAAVASFALAYGYRESDAL